MSIRNMTSMVSSELLMSAWFWLVDRLDCTALGRQEKSSQHSQQVAQSWSWQKHQDKQRRTASCSHLRRSHQGRVLCSDWSISHSLLVRSCSAPISTQKTLQPQSRKRTASSPSHLTIFVILSSHTRWTNIHCIVLIGYHHFWLIRLTQQTSQLYKRSERE